MSSPTPDELAEELRRVRQRISGGAVSEWDLQAISRIADHLDELDPADRNPDQGQCPSISPDGTRRCEHEDGPDHVDRHKVRMGPGSYLRWSDEEAARG